MSGEQRAAAAAIYEEAITTIKGLLTDRGYSTVAQSKVASVLKLLELELQAAMLGQGGVSVADLHVQVSRLQSHNAALQEQNERLRQQIADMLTSGWRPPDGKLWTPEEVARPIVVEVHHQPEIAQTPQDEPPKKPAAEKAAKKAPAKRAPRKTAAKKTTKKAPAVKVF